MKALIARLQAFGDLTAGQLSALEAMDRRPQRFERGAVVRRCEEESAPMFCVVSGWAVRCRLLADGQRQILSIIMPGDVCGMQALAGTVSDHHIIALTDLEVEACDPAAFAALLDGDHGLARIFLKGRVQDESMLREQVVRLGRRKAKARVLHLILELYERQRMNGEPAPERLAHALNRETLADLLGLSSVHVSRSLTTLAEEGIIRNRRGRITLTDPARAAAQCGYDSGYLRAGAEPADGDPPGALQNSLHKRAPA